MSANFSDWSVLSQDALPDLPDWIYPGSPAVWAPDVRQLDDGSFVLYFSAALANFPDHHCIGVATSKSSVIGPFTAIDKPLVCPDPNANGTVIASVISSPGQGGAIDASGFRDADGARYVLYKVDGNSVGNGGICGNTIAPIRPTPIMLVAVAEDGMNPLGSPIQLLDRTDADGPLVEAPSLARMADGSYSLFFSSNCFSTPNYDVSWAFASKITGPYTRSGPLLTTGVKGLQSPGGATVAPDGVHMVFHANGVNGRAMYTTTISSSGANLTYTS